jgi:peptidoglycan/xylan/chitin deacetylase (PgdA/CDA1 family)
MRETGIAKIHRVRIWQHVWCQVVLGLVCCCLMLESLPAAEAHAMKETTRDEVYRQLKGGEKLLQSQTYEASDLPTVYLTFDDGPSRLTGKVLDILKEEEVKATFFVLGEQSGMYKDAIRRIDAEGHALGNHSYNHEYAQLYGKSFGSFWSQIQQTDKILTGIVGKGPRLLRAPGGTFTNFDAFYYYLLDQAGYQVFDWDVDSGDSKRAGVPASEIIMNVKQTKLKQEMIVLLHDGAGHGESVTSLPAIIHYFKEKGYRFAALSSKVKPAQFPIGHIKWLRTVPSVTNFEEFLHQMESFALESQLKSKGTEVSKQVHKGEPLPPPLPPLELKIGKEAVGLQSNAYEIVNNRLQVPLRLLAEKMGGKVSWNEEKQTASVHLGMMDLEVDIAGKVVRHYVIGKLVSTEHLTGASIINGRIHVPLRQTVERLGSSVSGYAWTSAHIEAAVNLDPLPLRYI